ESISRVFATLNGLFDQLLKFLIPLIIVGLIVPSIAKLGDTAGKLLLITIALAYGSTIFAGVSSFAISKIVFPSLLAGQNISSVAEGDSGLEAYFTLDIPPLFDVMSALAIAFLLGIGLAKKGGITLFKMAEDFEVIITFLIEKLIIPLLPIF